jgi:hypothetical protein
MKKRAFLGVVPEGGSVKSPSSFVEMRPLLPHATPLLRNFSKGGYERIPPKSIVPYAFKFIKSHWIDDDAY